MPLTIVATSGASNANSYLTEAEADAYFESRVALVPPWSAASKVVLLVMATRVLDAAFRGQKFLVTARPGLTAYWKVGRLWTGAPATTTQRLAWPRIGMVDQNGNAIGSGVIPQDLKDATAELAGQLGTEDRTLDSDIVVRGITSVGAGSVSIGFRDSGVFPQAIPQAALDLILPSWYIEEQDEPTLPFMFEVL